MDVTDQIVGSGFSSNELRNKAVNWVETTDNEERVNLPSSSLREAMNYERLSYAVGSRWDFAKNMSLKVDVTYVDYKGTSGGFQENIETVGYPPLEATGNFFRDDSILYSAKLDFVF